MDEYEQAMQKTSTRDKKWMLLDNIRTLGKNIPPLILVVNLMTDDQIEALFRKIPEMDRAINPSHNTRGEIVLLSVLTINAAMKDVL